LVDGANSRTDSTFGKLGEKPLLTKLLSTSLYPSKLAGRCVGE
jgi:hypothetical protein